jgi:hypothetical protein
MKWRVDGFRRIDVGIRESAFGDVDRAALVPAKASFWSSDSKFKFKIG